MLKLEMSSTYTDATVDKDNNCDVKNNVKTTQLTVLFYVIFTIAIVVLVAV